MQQIYVPAKYFAGRKIIRIISYKITFDETSEIVTVKYNGAVSLQQRLNAVDDVCNSYAHLVPLRILVNVIDLDMQLSFDEQAYLGAHLAANKDLRNAKIAVLHEKNSNPNLIVDTTAYINGYQLVQFDSPDEAYLWLARA